MATNQNLEAVRGDTKVYNLTFTGQNITGWTVWMTIKSAYSDLDAAAKIQKTVTSHTNPTGGVTQITLTAADTDDLSGTYKYDIQIKKVDGSIETVLFGDIIFDEDVTLAIS